MSDVKFTIITVCYNSEQTIKNTIESVLEQSYDNYEYIVVDGGSKDKTLEIIREYELRFEGKLKYISEPDYGIYDAMNKGIKMASGDLVGIINSDDWYEKDCLQNIIDIYKGDEYAVFYGYMRFIDAISEKEIRCAIYNHEYIQDAMINHPTVFVSKKIYEEFGGYDVSYKIAADYDFIIKLTKIKKINFIQIRKIQANFRTGGASNSINAVIEALRIKKKYGYMTWTQYIAALCYTIGRKIFAYHVS